MTELDPLAPAADELASIASTDELLERLLVLRDAAEGFELLHPPEAEQAARRRRLGQLTQRLARLKHGTPTQRDALAAEFARTEGEFRALLLATPLAAFDDLLATEALAPRTVERVSHLLLGGAGAGEAVLRLERLAFSRLQRRDEGGRPALLPDDELSARLDRLGLVRLAPTDARRAALQFMLEATAELRGVETLEALGDGGLPGRVAGYRYALGRDALDPAILQSALEFELLLRETVDRLAGQRAGTIHAFEQRRRGAEDLARASVDRAREPEVTRPHERATGLRRLLRIGFFRFHTAAERRGPPVVPWLVALLVLGGLLAWALAPVGDPRRALAPDELAALSPLLVAGTVVAGPEGSGFLGAVDSERWTALDAEERSREAEVVRAALAEQDVAHGVVRADKTLAFTFDAGAAKVPR